MLRSLHMYIRVNIKSATNTYLSLKLFVGKKMDYAGQKLGENIYYFLTIFFGVIVIHLSQNH